jgi:hypothetical protein
MTTEPVQLERRSGQRFPLTLPLTIQVDGRTLPGFTQDVSSRGLFLYCDESLAEGTTAELTFTMPSEITLAENMRVRCHARVLRALPSQGGPRNGIAVQLESYQYLPSLESEPAPALARVSVAESAEESHAAIPR